MRVKLLPILSIVCFTVLFASCNRAKLESTKEVIDNQEQRVVTPPIVDNNQNLNNNTNGYVGGTFQGPPSADLEILLSSRPVNEASVNQQLTLRPSLTTIDPDNTPNNSCTTNPGIVEVRYRLPDGSWVSKTRTSACESFDHTFSYPTPGRYPILMRVISDEKEEAYATENLLITEPGFTFDENSGFGVTATPIVTNNGTTIQFNSAGCDTNQVEWSYADGSKGNGVSTTHTYQTSGQYYVRAFCSYEREGQTFARESSITVVIGGKDNPTQQYPQLEDPFIGTPTDQGCNVYVPTPQCVCPNRLFRCPQNSCTYFQSTCR